MSNNKTEMNKSNITRFIILTTLILMATGNEAIAQRFRRFGKNANTEEVVRQETVQETAQQTVQETAQQTAQQTVQEKVQETAQETVQQTVQQTAQETVQETVQQTEGHTATPPAPPVRTEASSRVSGGSPAGAAPSSAVALSTIRARYQTVADSRFESDGYARVVTNGRHGLVDREGREVLPTEYDNIGHNNFVIGEKDDYLPVCRNSLFGVINKRGRIIVPPISRTPVEREIEKQGYAPVCVNGKWGLVDTLGQYVITPRFDDELVVSEAYRNDAFQIRVLSFPHNQTGLIQQGRLVMPFQSDSIPGARNRFNTYVPLKKETPKVSQQVEYYN